MRAVSSIIIVTPGDYVCAIEEFSPGPGVYEEAGTVRACVTGTLSMDMERHVVSVIPMKKSPLIPRKGDIVLGVVSEIRKDVAEVDLYEVEGLKGFSTPFKATLHVSEIDVKFVDKVLDVLWLGDILRARVLSFRNPYPLSIKDEKLGVVLAFCSKCRHPLFLKAGRLTCPMCASQEQRKLSLNYLLRWDDAETRLIKSFT
ncbi:MAG: exosome complex RNA-binding protein Csl4 [Candidatus Nezhaarchaeota archaeon]|nr:exosome complex RNA-binding protein Csl4 [Candidatus Nezhaarchaeota archaeon]